jgi:Cu+-exporting ATPase
VLPRARLGHRHGHLRGGHDPAPGRPGYRRPEVTEVELVIGGMKCAACVARVQAKLNKVDGITATVNLAAERAHVTAPAHVSA